MLTCAVVFDPHGMYCLNYTDVFREQMISYVQDMSQPQYTETLQKTIEKEEVGLFFNLCVLL